MHDFARRAILEARMSVVFFFLDDPEGVPRECHRVLRPGGRLAIYATGPELLGNARGA